MIAHCYHCHREVNKPPSWIKRAMRVYCNDNCYHANRLTNLSMTFQAVHKRARAAYLANQGNPKSLHCARCGKKRKVSNIEIHHIDGWKHPTSNELSNLEALCVPCHNKTRGGNWSGRMKLLYDLNHIAE